MTRYRTSKKQIRKIRNEQVRCLRKYAYVGEMIHVLANMCLFSKFDEYETIRFLCLDFCLLC